MRIFTETGEKWKHNAHYYKYFGGKIVFELGFLMEGDNMKNINKDKSKKEYL